MRGKKLRIKAKDIKLLQRKNEVHFLHLGVYKDFLVHKKALTITKKQQQTTDELGFMKFIYCFQKIIKKINSKPKTKRKY